MDGAPRDPVSGDYDIGAPIDREFQDLVVFGITAYANPMDDRNRFGDPAEQPDELLPVRDTHVEIEFLT